MIWLLTVMVLVFIGAIGVMGNDDWLPYLLWTMLCVGHTDDVRHNTPLGSDLANKTRVIMKKSIQSTLTRRARKEADGILSRVCSSFIFIAFERSNHA